MENTHLAIGDSVAVRPGVTERGSGRDLGGWQGRIVELANRREQLIVAWDSVTLKNLLPEDILRCEEAPRVFLAQFWRAGQAHPADCGDGQRARRVRGLCGLA